MSSLAIYLTFLGSFIKSFASVIFGRLLPAQPSLSRDLTGQVAIITGANSGIGLSIAAALARQGATVYLACRSLERGNAAVERIIREVGAESKARIQCRQLDTSDLTSVNDFAKSWKNERLGEIDMLVHNAGITGPAEDAPELTKDGLGVIYATNFLGSFLLTHLLEKHLGPTARVVSTSSVGHYLAPLHKKPVVHGQAQSWISALYERLKLRSNASIYIDTKAQQILFSYILQRGFDTQPGNRRTAHAWSPGFTTSAILKDVNLLWRTWVSSLLFAILKVCESAIPVPTEEGAKTGAWLAGEGADLAGGGYWERMQRRTSTVDLAAGTMNQESLRSFMRGRWATWEADAGITWDIGI